MFSHTHNITIKKTLIVASDWKQDFLSLRHGKLYINWTKPMDQFVLRRTNPKPWKKELKFSSVNEFVTAETKKSGLDHPSLRVLVKLNYTCSLMNWEATPKFKSM